MIRKDIIYPFLLECCEFCKNGFWELVFEDLAYGKTPYGTYISKDFLCCSYKGKEFSYKIIRRDSKQLYTEIHNLLYKKLGLLSNEEKLMKKLEFEDVEKNIKENEQNSWGSIRKTKAKELLIELYVLDMKKKYNLTLRQSKFLLSLIIMGLLFKVICPKDIEFSDGKIDNIEGFEFSEKKIIIKRNIFIHEDNISGNIISKKKLMIDSWEKFLKEIRKCIIQN